MSYDIIIIGGGVAGLTSSIYAASRGLKVCVIEKEGKGGVIGKVSTITHYPGIVNGESGRDYYERLLSQVKVYDIDLRYEEVIETCLKGDIKSVKTREGSYQAKVVIIAAGTTPNSIGLPEENTHLHKGVSFCALEDIKHFIDREVFVVGGSDGALKEALYIAKFASKVNLIHFEDSISAVAEFRIPAENNDKIVIHTHKRVCKLEGDATSISAVYLKDEHDDSIEKLEIENTCVFIYAGATPNTQLFKEEVELSGPFIKTDDTMQTSIKGVYAVGDIRAKLVRQVATAASDGAIAAIFAYGYLNS